MKLTAEELAKLDVHSDYNKLSDDSKQFFNELSNTNLSIVKITAIVVKWLNRDSINYTLEYLERSITEYHNIVTKYYNKKEFDNKMKEYIA